MISKTTGQMEGKTKVKQKTKLVLNAKLHIEKHEKKGGVGKKRFVLAGGGEKGYYTFEQEGRRTVLVKVVEFTGWWLPIRAFI